MEIQKNQFSSIEQVTGKYLNNSTTKAQKEKQEESFQKILNSKVGAQEELKFSKHANARLDSRQIKISQEQMERLQNGAKKAGKKGIQESLVLVDSLAFIVDTKQNTVITAMNQCEAGENIYTNIDGAVII